ncbi:succinate-semialdehyde dehydrogenase [NADP+] (ssdh) [Afipia carboxidovorans OM5]|uniref:Succinate-semialdehyde dehydrogenase [NADP+] n=1 Tax=Afipia carboxidovorans (strain ATCC 49405 / DSM 1227 / KCTC 32145 / OM5) TaxID=504832 RepID=B6JID4_AFIC5|nr:NAD-dependent succinate-semialdehyde dehydrogenase [Afipia carboxidovorans]ACI94178.1 succinate-semialdehyde dehydrogenase [NADP+] (ssdh) [Afipia carboxidovorans OM5]AEI02170.1 succinate-semialdehyde dehydrogenase [NADP+] [Afipia carboxidovorans OM4]AEI05746.1 succinate-semialdehyde dehydrogenase [NADP+] [Afipia carboxidovorans OM5]
MASYSDTQLFIDGRWRDGSKPRLPVVNPATEEMIGTLAHAGQADLDEALAAAQRGFEVWRRTGALERSKLIRRAAEILRGRIDTIATLMTLEQGKPLVESRAEATGAADTIEWFAEETRRTYGRIVPARAMNVTQMVVKEPVGVAAAFTPWNFPLNQAVRKVSAALAAGCSIILKGPEETPASCAALIDVFAEAGIPDGVVNIVFGVPAEISSYLIPHPIIKKISFTGSTVVGKQLAAMAGSHMKRVTMELGGHAPALVFDDADVAHAVKILAANKFRNAGQVCVAPTRFLVQDKVYEDFLTGFVETAENVKVGDGMEKGTRMGPLANSRRLEAMEALVADATSRGAKVATGGERIGNRGYFFKPTVLTEVPLSARVMNEEPFGPVALISRFSDYDKAIAEANRLPYGLAAYAYTTSAKTMANLGRDIESGMVSINHHGIALPELPFGGIKDSGYGSEGGIEAVEAYLNTKLVTQAI